MLIDRVDGPLNKEQERSLEKVRDSARHLLKLIDDVLNISRIESAKMKLEIRELNMKSVITSAVQLFDPLIKQKNLTLSVNVDERLPIVYGDEEKVRQVLTNLLSNAVKFTARGGITITASLSEIGIDPGEQPFFMKICVADTGIGIKNEDLEKIFDKFVQIDFTLVRQYEGTGLGLSIAKGLVKLHKGTIWVSSKYGEGSTFCFTVPLKKEILEKYADSI
jgi:signal transduction histidine kinase